MATKQEKNIYYKNGTHFTASIRKINKTTGKLAIGLALVQLGHFINVP